MSQNPSRRHILGAAGLLLSARSSEVSAAEPQGLYDLVIADGRVMDPESGLDGRRHIGIRAGKVAAVSTAALKGEVTIDASGLIVAPGFIDLHSHAQNVPSNWMQAFDGVTTSLELESGAWPVAATYEARRREGSVLNYGYSVSWSRARRDVLAAEGLTETNGLISPGQSARVVAALERGLQDGGLGIGLTPGYAPASNRTEYYEAAALAARYDAPTFTHVRAKNTREPNGAIEGFEEVLAVAAATGARMHICHVNSSALREIGRIGAMIRKAQEQSLKITTESYPWGAGSTGIGAPFLRPENLPLLQIEPRDIVYLRTGERPETAARLAEIQAQDPLGAAVIHYLDEERPDDVIILDKAVLASGSVFASDAVPFTIDGKVVHDPVWPLPENAVTHPRSVATFTRVLGRYVRERRLLPMMEAIRRSTLFPAQILEPSVPAMRHKGRIRVGADADIVAFDPNTVIDRATYENPRSPSVGMQVVLVNGVFVVRDGVLAQSARPGRPVRGH